MLADPRAALCGLVDDTLTRIADADVANTVPGLAAFADLVGPHRRRRADSR